MNDYHRLLKIEHDAMVARFLETVNQANVDYLAMMADIDIPTEDEDAEQA